MGSRAAPHRLSKPSRTASSEFASTSSSGSSRALSDASAPEWTPPSHGGLPANIVWDGAYALAAVAIALVVQAESWAALPALALPLAQVLVALACGAAVFLGCRFLLPEVSYKRLIQSEAVLLATVKGDVRHHWSRFTTKHATWHVHSLLLRRNATVAAAAPSLSSAGGPEAAAPRPAVLLLHGHSAGAAHWEAVMDSIAEVADVHVLDLPGWGRSPAPPALVSAAGPAAYTSLTVEMLAGWLDCNKLARIVLLGHSFGGFTAIHFAHAHADRVVHLIVVAPAGLVPAVPEGTLLYGAYFKWAPPQRIARITGRLGLFVFRTLYLAFTTEDRRFPDYYYQLAAGTAETGMADLAVSGFMRLSTSAPLTAAAETGGRGAAPLLGALGAAARGELIGMFWSIPCLSLLQSLDMPVSVVWGQCDEIVPPIFGPLLHRIRPHTDLYIIKDALHNPAHNNGPAFCAAIADCLLKYEYSNGGSSGSSEGRGDANSSSSSISSGAWDGAVGGGGALIEHRPPSILMPPRARLDALQARRALPVPALREALQAWEDGTADRLLRPSAVACRVSESPWAASRRALVSAAAAATTTDAAAAGAVGQQISGGPSTARGGSAGGGLADALPSSSQAGGSSSAFRRAEAAVSGRSTVGAAAVAAIDVAAPSSSAYTTTAATPVHDSFTDSLLFAYGRGGSSSSSEAAAASFIDTGSGRGGGGSSSSSISSSGGASECSPSSRLGTARDGALFRRTAAASSSSSSPHHHPSAVHAAVHALDTHTGGGSSSGCSLVSSPSESALSSAGNAHNNGVSGEETDEGSSSSAAGGGGGLHGSSSSGGGVRSTRSSGSSAYAGSAGSTDSPHRWIDDWTAPHGGSRSTRAAGTKLRSFPPRGDDTSLSPALLPPNVSRLSSGGGAQQPQPAQAQQQQQRDGIVTALGRGRGYCNGCGHAVCLYKSYWRCACGAWSFNAAVSKAVTRTHFAALFAFLDELYVSGSFSALASPNIVMFLRPRTALPPAPEVISATAVAAAPPPGDGTASVSCRNGGFSSGTSGVAAESSLPPPLEQQRSVSKLKFDELPRMPEFAPLPSTFERGIAILLE